MKFGLADNAMESTIENLELKREVNEWLSAFRRMSQEEVEAAIAAMESPFESLRSAIGERGAINRIRIRRIGSPHETVLKGERALSLAAKVMDLAGERYSETCWVASADTCKKVGYGTVMVFLEHFED